MDLNFNRDKIGLNSDLSQSFVDVNILEPLLPPTQRPYSKRKVPPYIFTSIGLCPTDVGLQHSPSHGGWVFFFYFSSPLEDGKCGASTVIQTLGWL